MTDVMAGASVSPSISLTVKADTDIFADPSGTILRAKQHSSVLFRISVVTKLRKMKRAYCVKIGATPDSLVFHFAGFTVGDSCSASDLYMIEGDVIHVSHEPSYLINVARFPSTLVQDFGSLLSNGDFSDVVLVVGNEQVKIPALKAVLCARSDFFKSLLSENFKEGYQAEVILGEKQPHLVKILLKYLYTDQVELPEDLEDAVSLLMLADEFMVKRLKREVEIALLDQIKDKNVCSLLNTADVYSAPLLKEVCKQFILDNFESKQCLGEELQKTPNLLLEITRAAIKGHKRTRTS